MRKFKADLFWSKVEKSNGCWIWRGIVKPDGYGQFSRTGAHRVAYMLSVGPIPDGLEIDHLCFQILCVRPDHLEAVTHAENKRRRYARQTGCHRGHEFTEENTYRYGSRRVCRACNRIRVAQYAARKAVKAA